MNKIIKIALGATLLLSLSATTATADVKKGQKLYIKKLKASCQMSGAVMAGKHSQDEWTEIYEAGELESELKTICPKLGDVKDKYLPHFYDFFNEYASDSGNVPSC
ncbi:MAG: cytochrome C [Campylobacterota bacterium]|nr:cytochrome C [Campylobacterota bacterium]